MISIAMATYNGAKYIREQVDSILSQTIQDFELVICDDCSTDKTWDILSAYAAKDIRIKPYRNNQNFGFLKNFERVLTLCTSDYIALSDQDDIWTEDHLERLLEGMDGKVQIVCGKPLFVDEQNRELPSKYDYFKMDYVPQTNEDHARHIFMNRSTYQGASMLIKRDFLSIALPIPADVQFHDSWFAALACFSGGIIYVDEPGMRYRRYEKAATSQMMRQAPFRAFAAKVLVNHSLGDRLPMIRAIRERCVNLNKDKIELLNDIERMLSRRSSLVGRIRNIPYLLLHFKAIFCFDGKHFFR